MSEQDKSLSEEHRMIARLFAPLARDPGALGLKDDAAVYTPPEGHDLIITKDALVAGVHFFADDPADKIAQKSLRVNLSDLATKGAVPAGFLLAIALPGDAKEEWIAQFASGLGRDSESFACPLLGGDTVRTPGPLTISITAFGTVPRGTMVKRSGAKPDDAVFVSGTIGDAALGLRLRGPDCDPHLRERYLMPQPRTALAAALRAHASAAMDVSDGLAGDLAHLCRASGVTAAVNVAAVPLSDAAKRAIDAQPKLLEAALTGGDDYEILCTVAPEKADAFIAAAQNARVPVTAIGKIEQGAAAPRFLLADGRAMSLERMSFSHF